MLWWIIPGILILLGCLPLGISLRYDENGPVAYAQCGWLKYRLYPGRPSRKKKGKAKAQSPDAEILASEPAAEEKQEKPSMPSQAETQPSESAQTAQQTAPEKKAKKGGAVTDFLPLVRIVLELLHSFRRKLRARRLELKIILGGDDPCDLAVAYGRAWAALGNLMPQLERFLRIDKRDMQVECDFTAETTVVTARMDLSISLGRLLGLGGVYGFRLLKGFYKIRKGGAET